MKRSKTKTHSTRLLVDMICRACLIAKDAAFNVGDYIGNSSRIAFVAVQQCEKELDQIERDVDQLLPSAIAEVGEFEARQLLACLKFITDLERIGDLLCSVANGIHRLASPMHKEDSRHLLEMSDTLQTMLEDVHKGFARSDEEPAGLVLRNDIKIDQACQGLFRRHLQLSGDKATSDSIRLLFIAQAFERAGDHAKNLAEEIIHLVRGHTLKHASRTRLKTD
jgi:phosphate transport system protein